MLNAGAIEEQTLATRRDSSAVQLDSSMALSSRAQRLFGGVEHRVLASREESGALGPLLGSVVVWGRWGTASRSHCCGGNSMFSARGLVSILSTKAAPNEQLQPTPYCSGGAHRARLFIVAPAARRLSVLGRG